MRRSALLMGIGLVALLALAGCSSKEGKMEVIDLCELIDRHLQRGT